MDENDLDMPELKSDEVLCGGCWEIGLKTVSPGWLYYGFKTLEPVYMCPRCIRDHSKDLETRQRAGL